MISASASWSGEAELEITVLNRQRGRRVDAPRLRRFLERLIRELPVRKADSLALCLVSDLRMREYNRRYRGRDASTDVLSFPAGPTDVPQAGRHLGDIVIAVPTAARQAHERGHSLERELQLLALHGYLHLLGYDHETDDGTMLRLEGQLAGRLLRRTVGGRVG